MKLRHRHSIVIAFVALALRASTVEAAPVPPAVRARLAEVAALRQAGSYAAMESVATVLRDELAATPGFELLLGEAWYRIADARNLRRSGSATVLEASLKGLSLMESRPGAPDTVLYAAHRVTGIELSNSWKFEDAIGHLHQAVAIVRKHPEWGLAPSSAVLYNVGRTWTEAGVGDSAIPVLKEALEVRQKLNRKGDTFPGTILATLAKAYVQRGDVLGAEQSFIGAIRLQEESGGLENVGLVGPLADVAAFEQERGDFAGAADYYRRAQRILSKAEPKDPNVSLLGAAIAQCMFLMGDARGAADYFERANPGLEQAFGVTSPQALNGHLSLATALFDLEEDDRALAEYQYVRGVLARDTSLLRTELHVNALSNSAQILAERAPSDTALALAQLAEQLNEASGRPVLTLRSQAIQISVHARRKEWDEVDRIRAKLDREVAALPYVGGNDSDIIWKSRSEAELLRGRPDVAIREAAEGTRRSRERLVQNVRAMSDRQAMMLSSTLSASLDQLLEVGALADPKSRHLCWDELVRVRGLVRAEISRRRLPPQASTDTALAAAHANWLKAQQSLAELLGTLASSAREASDDSMLAARRNEADEAERLLVRRFPAAQLAGDPASIGIDSVLARLGEGRALAAFVQAPSPQGGRHLVAFVAAANSHAITSLDLGESAGIETLVERFRAELSQTIAGRRDERVSRREGERVRRQLWDPIVKAAGAAREIVLVPDAPLEGFPWGALPQGDRYLVESELRIRLLDAERDLESPATAPLGSGLLAIGGIDYEHGESLVAALPDAYRPSATLRAASTPCDSAVLAHFASLPGTATEIRDVESAWSREGRASGAVTQLAGASASEAEFKRLAPGKRVLHIATHGIVLGESCADAAPGTRGVGGVEALASRAKVSAKAAVAGPGAGAKGAKPASISRTRSPLRGRQVFLVLADANHVLEGARDENEGLLTADEVGTLDLRGVDWVVLSACHSAAGEFWKGEGVVGMQRAFLLAGARTVIASQWSVEDEATREWMRALYDARANGQLRAAEAMAAADRTVLAARRKSGRSTHPFYWAAFTSSGH